MRIRCCIKYTPTALAICLVIVAIFAHVFGYEYRISRAWLFLAIVTGCTLYLYFCKEKVKPWLLIFYWILSEVCFWKFSGAKHHLIIYTIWSGVLCIAWGFLLNVSCSKAFRVIKMSLCVLMIGINALFPVASYLLDNPYKQVDHILSPNQEYTAVIYYCRDNTGWKGDTELEIVKTDKIHSIQMIFGKATNTDRILTTDMDYYIDYPDNSKTKWISDQQFQFYDSCIDLTD